MLSYWEKRILDRMTDSQLLTLAIAPVIPISLLLYSNSRITDTKEILRAEMGTFRAEMQAGFQRMDQRMEQMEGRFDIVMSKLVHIDNRLSKVEDKLGL